MKTSELIGPALDWAVVTAEGKFATYSPYVSFQGTVREKVVGWGVYLDPPERDEFGVVPFTPSANWSQGGPIIEREGIHLRAPAQGQDAEYVERLQYLQKDEWFARIAAEHTSYLSFGPTPLIAAMRCYVASKLGNDVEIPKEFL